MRIGTLPWLPASFLWPKATGSLLLERLPSEILWEAIRSFSLREGLLNCA